MEERHTFYIHCLILRYTGFGMFKSPHLNDFDNFPNRLYRAYSFTVMVLFTAFVTSEFLGIIFSESFDDLFFSISLFLGHGALAFRSISWLYYNKEIQRVIHTLEVRLKILKQNERAMKKYKRQFYLISIFFGSAAFFTLTSFNITALNKEYKRIEKAKLSNVSIYKHRILPIPRYNFVDEEPNWWFILQWFFQDYGMYGISIVVVTMDCFVAGLLLHIAGQFINAQDYFANIKRDVYESLYLEAACELEDLNPEDINANIQLKLPDNLEDIVNAHYEAKQINDKMYFRLRKGVKFHQILLNCTRDLQAAYSISFLGQLFISLLSISLTLWMGVVDLSIHQSVTSLGFLQSGGFFASLAIQLYIQTSSANELTMQSEKLASRAAECLWYETDTRFRKTLLTVIMRAQVPIHMSAGGITTMSNRTFLEIMHKSYSAFAMLIRFKH